MTLDKFGSGCRCLLRARENLGKPYVADETFLARHQNRYPDWETHPGAAGTDRLIELAKLMGVARRGEIVRGYEQLISSHDLGAIVLIVTRDETGPAAAGDEEPRVALLEDIDPAKATAWLPTPDGSADVVEFPRAAFEETGATSAIVFQPEP